MTNKVIILNKHRQNKKDKDHIQAWLYRDEALNVRQAQAVAFWQSYKEYSGQPSSVVMTEALHALMEKMTDGFESVPDKSSETILTIRAEVQKLEYLISRLEAIVKDNEA